MFGFIARPTGPSANASRRVRGDASAGIRDAGDCSTSQPYYVDITHPLANKGTVVERLSRYLKIPPEQIATIGDQLNDVLMFKRSGLSIAMGNASEEVQRQDMCVTTSHADEGFANAIEKYIIPLKKR